MVLKAAWFCQCGFRNAICNSLSALLSFVQCAATFSASVGGAFNNNHVFCWEIGLVYVIATQDCTQSLLPFGVMLLNRVLYCPWLLFIATW